MARPPIPLGSWGRISVSPVRPANSGKAARYRARTSYRDYNGVTRDVAAEGRTRTQAEQSLTAKLRELSAAKFGATLKSTDRFSAAAEIWIGKIHEMVVDGRRSVGTLETYRGQLDRHVLPALGAVRLVEVSPILLDRMLGTIKRDISPATARSCRSVISGVLGVAVRHGAISANPIRDIERLSTGQKRAPRALDEDERRRWFDMLAADPKAQEADLPDLTGFMLATGARIGETLGLRWRDVDLVHGEVSITQQVIRVKGEGLIGARTKSSAGERVLRLPDWALEILQRRAARGVDPEEPVFGDALGGFRDPTNVRRHLRRARSPVGDESRQELGSRLRAARRAAKISRAAVATSLKWPRTRVELIETARVRVDSAAVGQLLDLYATSEAERREITAMAAVATKASEADALTWITSHTFRRTTATILDDAGQSARQIADQLGHARPSLTQDVYMGRKARNPAAASALDQALRGAAGTGSEEFSGGFSGGSSTPDTRKRGQNPR